MNLKTLQRTVLVTSIVIASLPATTPHKNNDE
jgi:hypothetical protein